MEIFIFILLLISCTCLIIELFSRGRTLFWLNPEKRPKNPGTYYAVATILLVIVSFALSTQKPTATVTSADISTTSTNTTAVSTPKPPIAFPAEEQQLVDIVDQYATLYEQADNELKKSKVWKERSAVFHNKVRRDTKNWIGTIEEMGTNGEGKAYITLRINDKISIGTSNNSFSDFGDNTLIPQSSPMYDVIANLKKGDAVKFSATILRLSNLTESGKMTGPDFLAKFKDIQPLQN